ncbi:MAG TPA: CHRD domain-containing protein [Actinomycetes bacterium]
MRRFARFTVTAVVTIGLVAPGAAALAEVPQHRVTLVGSAEAPDPGDPNGRGQFSWSLDGRELCYLLSVRRIGTAAAAHIHRGRIGVAGPVRVELEAPRPASADCVTLSSTLSTALREHPRRFYVNVHTAAYPNGAIRAQLTR